MHFDFTQLHVGKLPCGWCDATGGLVSRGGSNGPCLGEVPTISKKEEKKSII